ncbi:MAG TPA: carbohydrate porin, partial [Polyangia bacterium]
MNSRARACALTAALLTIFATPALAQPASDAGCDASPAIASPDSAPTPSESRLAPLAPAPDFAPAVEAPTVPPVDLPPGWLARALGPDDWGANFHATYIWQRHGSFPSAYSGQHSLTPTKEVGYSLTATLYLGHRLWKGGELFFNPEIIQSIELSHLHGLGGLSNGENQKFGGPTARLYSARAFVRQTVNFGGTRSPTEAGPNQFAGEASSHRLVITAGQMSLIDIFDNNAFAHDPRTQFLNWALLAQGASDYAADARGYTWGLTVEYLHDDWAFRIGHFAQPKESNGLTMDFKLWQHFGENLEIE